MRIVIVGAGPTGLFVAISLARRGHDVVVIDRDGGPPPAGSRWDRKGVMQFHHAHTFRGQVVAALRAEMPEVLANLTAAGARIELGPDGRPLALLCRRTLFERMLRNAATAEPGVALIIGHAEGIRSERGRVSAITVDGRTLPAALIIDASGRAGRFTDGIRPRAEGDDCGAVYVTRQFSLRDGVPAGPVNSPIGLSLGFAGYFAVAFLHDGPMFSVTFTHDGSDKRLRRLRHDEVFDEAVRAIPRLSEWTDPTRSQPVSPALPGGRLYNTYRGQLDRAGRPVLTGLISVGDAVCTTTPLAGRGVSLALLQAGELVRILELAGDDIVTATTQFDRWCVDHIRPWFDDHRHTDADRMRRWSGGDVDLRRRLPSDLIVAAGAVDPRVTHIAGPYTTMDALPASLTLAEPLARAVYATGWRPPPAAGPTREELAEICGEDASAA